MEVIRQGSPTRWSVEVECTGVGNGGYGCDSLLKVNTDDLRYYEGTDYPVYRSKAVTMKCPICNKLTDIPEESWPMRYYDLEKYTNAWAEGTE